MFVYFRKGRILSNNDVSNIFVVKNNENTEKKLINFSVCVCVCALFWSYLMMHRHTCERWFLSVFSQYDIWKMDFGLFLCPEILLISNHQIAACRLNWFDAIVSNIVSTPFFYNSSHYQTHSFFHVSAANFRNISRNILDSSFSKISHELNSNRTLFQIQYSAPG